MAKKNVRNTRGRIVSAAWRLFYEQGYEDTTVEKIIELSHTSRGSFYHYFDGKDALLSTLSDERDNPDVPDFGLDREFLDMPDPTAEMRMITPIREAVEQWEPRATVRYRLPPSGISGKRPGTTPGRGRNGAACPISTIP